MDIAGWLQEFDLEQYARAFREDDRTAPLPGPYHDQRSTCDQEHWLAVEVTLPVACSKRGDVESVSFDLMN